MSAPALSIVVPTRNRQRILSRTLVALLEQQGVAGDYEVIVVVDGSTDGTLSMLRRPAWGTRLRVVSQPHRGLAAARNRGAMEARGGIVLFLDDDMIAGPGLAATHLEQHAAGPRKVVLGALSLAEGVRRSFLKEGVAAWSRDMNRRLSEPGYRLRFDDWSFGNASVDRVLFRDAGGFDETFVSYGNEDYDLGWRLIQRGVEVRFAPSAVARQIYDKSFTVWLRDVYHVGRADVVLAQKYPSIAADLRLSRVGAHPLKRLARWCGLASLDPVAPAWVTLAGALAVAERLALRGAFLSHAQSLIGERTYWRGVRDAGRPAFPALVRPMNRPGSVA